MLGLKPKEVQELLKVIDYVKLEKEVSELNDKFKVAQDTTTHININDFNRYRNIYKENYDTIHKKLYKEMKELDNKKKRAIKNKHDMESYKILNSLNHKELYEFTFRAMCLDYHGVDFDNFDILKLYVQNDLEDHKDIDKLNNYLKDWKLNYDEKEKTFIVDDEFLTEDIYYLFIVYIIDLFPPVSIYKEVSDTANNILKLVKQLDK